MGTILFWLSRQVESEVGPTHLEIGKRVFASSGRTSEEGHPWVVLGNGEERSKGPLQDTKFHVLKSHLLGGKVVAEKSQWMDMGCPRHLFYTVKPLSLSTAFEHRMHTLTLQLSFEPDSDVGATAGEPKARCLATCPTVFKPCCSVDQAFLMHAAGVARHRKKCTKMPEEIDCWVG